MLIALAMFCLLVAHLNIDTLSSLNPLAGTFTFDSVPPQTASS
jgi:hypothetical protein